MPRAWPSSSAAAAGTPTPPARRPRRSRRRTPPRRPRPRPPERPAAALVIPAGSRGPTGITSEPPGLRQGVEEALGGGEGHAAQGDALRGRLDVDADLAAAPGAPGRAGEVGQRPDEDEPAADAEEQAVA